MDKQFFYNNFNFYYLDSNKNLLKKNIKSAKNKKLNIPDLLSPKGVESTSMNLPYMNFQLNEDNSRKKNKIIETFIENDYGLKNSFEFRKGQSDLVFDQVDSSTQLECNNIVFDGDKAIFNGVNGYINSKELINSSEEISFEIYLKLFKPEDIVQKSNEGIYSIFTLKSKGMPAPNNHLLHNYFKVDINGKKTKDSQMYINIAGGDVMENNFSSDNHPLANGINYNNYTHIVITYGGGKVKYYKNKVLLFSKTQESTITTPRKLFFGVPSTNDNNLEANLSAEYPRMDLKFFRIYSKTLNESQISTLYTNRESKTFISNILDVEPDTLKLLSDSDKKADTENPEKFNETLKNLKLPFYIQFKSEINKSRKEIIYKRLTPIDDINMHKLLHDEWNNMDKGIKNNFNVDFELYSNLTDAIYQENKWQFCSFNETDVGFPGKCGPEESIKSAFIGKNKKFGWKKWSFSLINLGKVKLNLQTKIENYKTLLERDEQLEINKDFEAKGLMTPIILSNSIKNGIYQDSIKFNKFLNTMPIPFYITYKNPSSENDKYHEIVYKRLTSLDGLDMYKLLHQDWSNENGSFPTKNKFNKDFKLYSNLDHALFINKFKKVKIVNPQEDNLVISEIQVWIDGKNVVTNSETYSEASIPLNDSTVPENAYDKMIHNNDQSKIYISQKNEDTFFTLILDSNYDFEDLESVIVYNSKLSEYNKKYNNTYFVLLNEDDIEISDRIFIENKDKEYNYFKYKGPSHSKNKNQLQSSNPSIDRLKYHFSFESSKVNDSIFHVMNDGEEEISLTSPYSKIIFDAGSNLSEQPKEIKNLGKLNQIFNSSKYEITTVINIPEPHSDWRSVYHYGNSDDERSPAMWLYPNFGRIWRVHFRLRTKRNFNDGFDFDIPTKHQSLDKDIEIKIIIEKNLVQGGENGFKITAFANSDFINSITIASEIIQLENKSLWIKDPWWSSKKLKIKSLVFKGSSKFINVLSDDCRYGEKSFLSNEKNYLLGSNINNFSEKGMTFSFWVKDTKNSGTSISIVEGNVSSPLKSFLVEGPRSKDSKLSHLVIKIPKNKKLDLTSILTNKNISSKKWTHFCITLGKTAKFYLDGKLTFTDNDYNFNGTNWEPTNTKMALGRIANANIDSDNNSSVWSGKIDDVRFYDKEISNNEVTNIYNIKNTLTEIKSTDKMLSDNVINLFKKNITIADKKWNHCTFNKDFGFPGECGPDKEIENSWISINRNKGWNYQNWSFSITCNKHQYDQKQFEDKELAKQTIEDEQESAENLKKLNKENEIISNQYKNKLKINRLSIEFEEIIYGINTTSLDDNIGSLITKIKNELSNRLSIPNRQINVNISSKIDQTFIAKIKVNSSNLNERIRNQDFIKKFMDEKTILKMSNEIFKEENLTSSSRIKRIGTETRFDYKDKKYDIKIRLPILNKKFVGKFAFKSSTISDIRCIVPSKKIKNEYIELGKFHQNENTIKYENTKWNLCADRCDEIENCNAYTKNLKNIESREGCWYKSEIDRKVLAPSSDHHTFHKSNKYEFVGFEDYPGNNIEAFDNYDNHLCSSLCDEKSDCIGFVENKDSKGCYIKNKFGNRESSDSKATYKKIKDSNEEIHFIRKPISAGEYIWNNRRGRETAENPNSESFTFKKLNPDIETNWSSQNNFEINTTNKNIEIYANKISFGDIFYLLVDITKNSKGEYINDGGLIDKLEKCNYQSLGDELALWQEGPFRIYKLDLKSFDYINNYQNIESTNNKTFNRIRIKQNTLSTINISELQIWVGGKNIIQNKGVYISGTYPSKKESKVNNIANKKIDSKPENTYSSSYFDDSYVLVRLDKSYQFNNLQAVIVYIPEKDKDKYSNNYIVLLDENNNEVTDRIQNFTDNHISNSFIYKGPSYKNINNENFSTEPSSELILKENSEIRSITTKKFSIKKSIPLNNLVTQAVNNEDKEFGKKLAIFDEYGETTKLTIPTVFLGDQPRKDTIDGYHIVTRLDNNDLFINEIKYIEEKDKNFFIGVKKHHPIPFGSKYQTYICGVNDNLCKPNPCVGDFGECDEECDKTYSIKKHSTLGGESCPYKEGEMVKCKPGEGKCPMPKEGEAVNESFAVVEKMSNTYSIAIFVFIILLVLAGSIAGYYFYKGNIE